MLAAFAVVDSIFGPALSQPPMNSLGKFHNLHFQLFESIELREFPDTQQVVAILIFLVKETATNYHAIRPNKKKTIMITKHAK